MSQLEELRTANIARQAEWCPDQVPDLAFRGVELAGEAGEACNVIKKLERERQGWAGSRATLDDLAQELADVVICVDLVAMQFGLSVWPAIVAKFNATSEARGLATKLAPAEARAGALDVLRTIAETDRSHYCDEDACIDYRQREAADYLASLQSASPSPAEARADGVRQAMAVGKTARGFAIAKFTDLNGVDCTLQKSSLATEDAIWLGASDIGLKRFTPYAGWEDVPTPSAVDGVKHVANTRMHLTREQVADLLPALKHFVDTGELTALESTPGRLREMRTAREAV